MRKKTQEKNEIKKAVNLKMPSAPQAKIRRTMFHVAMIVCLGILVYSNTFHSPFTFDDESGIYRNAAVTTGSYYTKTSVVDRLLESRLVGQWSFALNHRLHGFDVTGYHVLNLLIHIGSGLLFYWMVLLIFRTPAADGLKKAPEGFPGDGEFFALCCALLFVSHPVQTQAVTYIVQRYTSLAAFFYLLSLALYIRFRLSESSGAGYAFYAASIFSAVLAMKTKEIAFTLPLMVVICEFLFFYGAWKKRLIYLSPMLLTMAVIPLSLMLRMQGVGASAAEGLDELTKVAGSVDVSRWDYLNTQFRVIVTYIRLLFLPVCQNLDYDYPIYRTFFMPPVFFSFLFLLSVFSCGVYLLLKSFREGQHEHRFMYRLIAFGIFWFFVTLSVESSVIPILDVINEHRLYLPSAGFILAVLGAAGFMMNRLEKRRAACRVLMIALALLVVALSVTAYARNAVWRDEVSLWTDIVKKSPEKARPHNNLGELFFKRGQLEEAHLHYKKALSISPYFVHARINLGALYEKQGLLKDALEEYQIAAKFNPESAEAYYNMGCVQVKLGKIEMALSSFEKAVKIRPTYADAHYNLANTFYGLRLYDKAIQQYKMAIKYKPDFFAALNNLGNVYIDLNRLDEAIQTFQDALVLENNSPEAHYNLGNAYLHKGDYQKAFAAFKRSLALNPDDADAQKNVDILKKLLK